MKGKKEIGTQKLLELLNKHRVELAHGNIQNQLMRHYNGYVFGLGDLNSQNCILLIISKEYGFIKWLVENDKIDRDKELKENGLFRKYFYDLEYVKNYDRLVMWLSVEDEPIRFLCEILK